MWALALVGFPERFSRAKRAPSYIPVERGREKHNHGV